MHLAMSRPPRQPMLQPPKNRIGMVILPQVDLVPFTGKFSLFGKLFMNYDLYLLAGPALVNLISKTPTGANLTTECRTDPDFGQMCKARPYTGMKFGGNVGFGMHAFVNNYFAINVEAHNLIYKNNAAGRDVNGNGDVNSFRPSVDVQLDGGIERGILPSGPRQSQPLASAGTTGQRLLCRRRGRSRFTSMPRCWRRPRKRPSGKIAPFPGSSRPHGGSPETW